MSIRYNSVKLASANTYHPDLFDVKWSDHILDNISWLRADTFSWHYGELYTRAYQHLTKDITNKILQSETVAGITIQYYLANDGHKVCPDTEEENVQDLYEETGIAWYYIIDTTNHRFKLPRTKYAFTGVRNNVGKFVEAGLPQIDLTNESPVMAQGANYEAKSNRVQISSNGTGSGASPSGYGNSAGIGYALDKSAIGSNVSEIIANNSIYGNSTTVQSPATEMYLYFYVGNFAQKDITTTYGPEFMAHQAMPSDRYVDLTLGASGSTYIAPADGYFTISVQGTSDNNVHYVIMSKTKFEAKESNNQLDEFCATTLAVRKGDEMLLRYNNVVMNTSSGCYFCFVYAEGSK